MQTALYTSTVTATQEQVDNLMRELLPAQGQWSEEAYLWLTVVLEGFSVSVDAVFDAQ